MTIDFNQVQPSYTPSTAIELDRTGGSVGLSRDQKKLLLLGYKTSAGTKAVGAVERITSIAQAMEYWGEGSTLAVMAQEAMDVAPGAPIYGMAFTESAGVAAAGTIVFATTASSPGVVTVMIAGYTFQIAYAIGDTPTIIGDALVAAVAQKRNLPFTAVNTTGSVAIAARNKGVEGNTILMNGSITAGTAVTMTITQLSGGTLVGDPTAQLAAIEGDRYHLICGSTNDATTLGIITAHLEKQSLPNAGKWGIGIIGFTGTRSAACAIATTDDSYNSQIVWLQSCDKPSYVLAARFAALRATKAANVGVINTELPGIYPPVDDTKWPTPAEIEAAIEGGVTPIVPLRTGQCLVSRSVISRQTAPISYRDHNVEEIWHYTAENIIAAARALLEGKRLKSASPPGTPSTVTPGRATAILNGVLFSLDKLDYLQGVKASISAGHNFMEVNELEPTTRLDGVFDYIPVGFVVQTAIKGVYKKPFTLAV